MQNLTHYSTKNRQEMVVSLLLQMTNFARKFKIVIKSCMSEQQWPSDTMKSAFFTTLHCTVDNITMCNNERTYNNYISRYRRVQSMQSRHSKNSLGARTILGKKIIGNSLVFTTYLIISLTDRASCNNILWN